MTSFHTSTRLSCMAEGSSTWYQDRREKYSEESKEEEAEEADGEALQDDDEGEEEDDDEEDGAESTLARNAKSSCGCSDAPTKGGGETQFKKRKGRGSKATDAVRRRTTNRTRAIKGKRRRIRGSRCGR